MPARKLSANFIFDGRDRLIRNGILTMDDKGRVVSLREAPENGREEANVEFYNGILCPGFINTHCHLELSHIRGMIGRGGGLEYFIPAVISGREADQEIMTDAMMKADEAMRSEGIVAIGDISNSDESFAVKAASKLQYHTFIELFGFDNSAADRIYSKGLQLLKHAEDDFNISVTLTPHSAYAVSEKLFRLISGNHGNSKLPLSIHNQETLEENLFIALADGQLYRMYKDRGLPMPDVVPHDMNSMSWLSQMAGRSHRLLLVHNVATTAEDINNSGIDTTRTWWSLCPASNQYISGSLPPAFLQEKYPHMVCIGTDSLASNDRLSILSELLLLQDQSTETDLPRLLRFACLNGAEALGLDHALGSFDAGKSPGINLLLKADLQTLRLNRDTKVKVMEPANKNHLHR